MSPSLFRNIFSICAPMIERGMPPSFSYGLTLAEASVAHLTVQLIGQKFDPPYSLAPGFVASLTGPANAEEHQRLEATESALRAQLKAWGGQYEAYAGCMTLDQALARVGFLARIHDVSVMDEPSSHLAWGRVIVEELLFHSGRPVIVVPRNTTAFKARRIVVAWDGTARAARALNDAMPLLRQAESVELVSVQGEKDISHLPAGTNIAAHLSRHGVTSTVVGLDVATGGVGSTLRDRAALVGADMIVMGAFAHSRWRQLVFGGVTDSMLHTANIPVFYSG